MWKTNEWLDFRTQWISSWSVEKRELPRIQEGYIILVSRDGTKHANWQNLCNKIGWEDRRVGLQGVRNGETKKYRRFPHSLINLGEINENRIWIFVDLFMCESQRGGNLYKLATANLISCWWCRMKAVYMFLQCSIDNALAWIFFFKSSNETSSRDVKGNNMELWFQVIAQMRKYPFIKLSQEHYLEYF